MPPAISTTTLQSQYPLSPRKFWKKMIEKLPAWIILFFVLAFFFVLVGGPVIYGGMPVDAVERHGAGLTLASVVVWLGIIGVYAIYVKWYIKTYFYDANDNFLTIKKGVFAPTEIHVQYQKIQDVYVDQDILDRVMGLYDVHIASATVSSGIEAHIDGVEREAAEGLKQLLLAKIQGTTVPQVQSGAVPGEAPRANLTEEVSNKTYPIVGRWVVLQLIGSLIASAVEAAALMYVFVGYSGKDGEGETLSQVLGIGSGTLWSTAWTLVAILFVLNLAYQLLWRATFSFALLPEFVQMRQGVIARQETHLPYRTIQDVTVSQSVFENMLGIATVRIANASAPVMYNKKAMPAPGFRIPGQPLAKANHLSDILRGITVTKNSVQTGL